MLWITLIFSHLARQHVTGPDLNLAVLAFHEKAMKPFIMGSKKKKSDIYCHLKKKKMTWL